MRLKERIDILEPYLKENLSKFLDCLPMTSSEKKELELNIINDWKLIIDNWKLMSDLRFFQLLMSLDYISNMQGIWFYIEEDDWLIEKKLAKFEDIKLWGNNFDIDMNRLPETIWKPISSLNTGHIQAILNGKFTQNKEYIRAFKRVLITRIKEVKI